MLLFSEFHRPSTFSPTEQIAATTIRPAITAYPRTSPPCSFFRRVSFANGYGGFTGPSTPARFRSAANGGFQQGPKLVPIEGGTPSGDV
jgi:hypothetical protein